MGINAKTNYRNRKNFRKILKEQKEIMDGAGSQMTNQEAVYSLDNICTGINQCSMGQNEQNFHCEGMNSEMNGGMNGGLSVRNRTHKTHLVYFKFRRGIIFKRKNEDHTNSYLFSHTAFIHSYPTSCAF